MKYLEPNWPAPKQIRAYTTLRTSWGGRSSGPGLQELLPLPSEPIWTKQTHSNIAIEARPENIEKEADAAFSTEPNRVCVMQTADCLPLLVCDKEATYVASIHAGWRGLAGGVIESTISHYSGQTENLLVWLGPAIGPNKFEVGNDVYHAFIDQNAKASAAFINLKENKWLANIYELARMRLQQLGISQIYGGQYCTHTQSDLFFSYRRDQGQTGRMASLIWMDPQTVK